MKASDARAQWSHVLNKVARRETRVVVEKSGVPVAAIISADDLERLNRMEQEREARWDAWQEIAARNAEEDPEAVERFVLDEIQAMRAEKRAKAAASPKA